MPVVGSGSPMPTTRLNIIERQAQAQCGHDGATQRHTLIYFFITPPFPPLPPPGGRIGRGGFGGGLLGFPTVGAGKLANGPLFALQPKDEFW